MNMSAVESINNPFQFVNEDPCGLSDWTARGITGHDRLDEIEMQMPVELLNAFDEMREEHLITDLGTSDCNTCGGYVQTLHAVELDNLGVDVKGCVSFTGQDDHEAPNLRYGPLNSDEEGQIGLDAKEIGDIVANILDDHGISYEWNGDPSKTIRVVEE